MAVHDPAEVPPDAGQERHELADVVQFGADPGDDQGRPDVEQSLQQQYREGQEPVPGQRFTVAEHDDGHDHQGQHELLEFHDDVGQRQRRAGELQRADQRQVVVHDPRADQDRPLGEGKDENADDQIRDVMLHAAVGLEQDAEDQVVDRAVEQRGEYLPDLAEPGVGVHRHVPGGRVGHDEVPALPQLAEVLQQAGPLRAGPQPVLGGQLGQRHSGQRGRGLADAGRVLQASRGGELRTFSHDCEFYGSRPAAPGDPARAVRRARQNPSSSSSSILSDPEQHRKAPAMAGRSRPYRNGALSQVSCVVQ